MTQRTDTVIIGGGSNGLVAAIALARAGSKVIVVEAAAAPGGALREIEFAPGFRAAPLASDQGWIPADVARGVGLGPWTDLATDPTVTAIGPDGQTLALRRQVAETATELRRFSAKDAERWPAFAKLIGTVTAFLEQLYVSPAPRVDASSIGEFFALAKVGRSLRGLGKREMVEVLRTVPLAAAELFDDWFESDLLKGALSALAVTDLAQGPMSGGTAFAFLHRHVGAAPGVFGQRVRLADGGAGLVATLVERALAVGVEIRCNAAVDSILVRDDVIAGVRLADGVEISAREVVSSLDAHRTLLELLDPVHLDPEFIHAVKQIRYRGVTTKLLLAMDQLPALPHGGAGALVIAPSVRHVEKAYDASKYGRASDEPMLELRCPTVGQPNLAPAGKHVAILSVQFTPYRLREGTWAEHRDPIAARALDAVERAVPGFRARILHQTVLTPVDLEMRFGLREGALSQGEMLLDQILFMRPVAGWSRYAMPVPGLYLCGASTHPGGGVTGMSGWLAAQAVLSGRAPR